MKHFRENRDITLFLTEESRATSGRFSVISTFRVVGDAMAGQEGIKTVPLKQLPSDLPIVERYRTNAEFLEAFSFIRFLLFNS